MNKSSGDAQPRRRPLLRKQHAGGISRPNLLPDEAAETQLSQLMNAGKNNKVGRDLESAKSKGFKRCISFWCRQNLCE